MQQAEHYLVANGQIFLEIAHDQGKMVEQLARQYFPKARSIRVHKDYNDPDRIVRIVM